MSDLNATTTDGELLRECLEAQKQAGFKFEDRRVAKCPDCQVNGYNTGYGYWAFECGAEITSDGEPCVTCGGSK